MSPEPLFGVAGNPPSFFKSQFGKERANAPAWLAGLGLDALEVQCTFGVRMPPDRAQAFRAAAVQHGIVLTLHAPYYIDLASENPAILASTFDHLTKAVALAKLLACRRVIFHPGSAGKGREAALSRAIEALKRFVGQTDLGEVCLFPEIGGKVGQLGSLDEILALCQAVEPAWPCLDLAHLHAREGGSLQTADDFRRVLGQVHDRLGEAALERLHVHLYPITWGARGEVSHRPFRRGRAKDNFSPDYRLFLDVIAREGIAPIIISEAADSQDVGALEMKRYFTALPA